MSNVLSYHGKRVVITGCYSGIGRATAELLLDLGAEVHGLDLHDNGLKLQSFTALDLRDPASIAAAVSKIGGRVDALFNCAGVPPGLPPLDVLKVNFIGTRLLTERVVELMPQGSAIVSTASNGGAGWSKRVPTLMQLIAAESYEQAVAWCQANAALIGEGYSFSKEALIVWTLSLSQQLIKRGIRINATSPGAVQTPMLVEIEKVTPTATIDIVVQPIGRRSLPVEQAYPLLMLNSDAASYINGALLQVDGGFMGGRQIAPADSVTAIGRR